MNESKTLIFQLVVLVNPIKNSYLIQIFAALNRGSSTEVFEDVAALKNIKNPTIFFLKLFNFIREKVLYCIVLHFFM